MEAAAIVIQSHYRGYITRKRNKEIDLVSTKRNFFILDFCRQRKKLYNVFYGKETTEISEMYNTL